MYGLAQSIQPPIDMHLIFMYVKSGELKKNNACKKKTRKKTPQNSADFFPCMIHKIRSTRWPHALRKFNQVCFEIIKISGIHTGRQLLIIFSLSLLHLCAMHVGCLSLYLSVLTKEIGHPDNPAYVSFDLTTVSRELELFLIDFMGHGYMITDTAARYHISFICYLLIFVSCCFLPSDSLYIYWEVWMHFFMHFIILSYSQFLSSAFLFWFFFF